MLSVNVDINDRLINGQMGTIARIVINQNKNKQSVIFIKFDDCQAGVYAISKCTDRYARENNAVPIQPVLSRIKVTPGKPSSPEIQRLQFPTTLAWACTVRKVRGLTLNEVVVTFQLRNQKSFNPGQIYVALSRATSFQGLYILGNMEDKHIKANPKAHFEYQQLRQVETENSKTLGYSPSSLPKNAHHKLSICLLNVPSLKKHSINIKCDVNLMKSDVLALTETQLFPHDSDVDIQENLKSFGLYGQDQRTDKCLSLAIMYLINYVYNKQTLSCVT